MMIFICIIIIGLAFMRQVAIRPTNFGKLYVVAAILLSGMVYQHCSFIDEYLVACVLIGGFLVLALRFIDTSSLPENGFGKVHKIFFYVLCFYFAGQSVRGMLLTDISKIRWVFYFLSIALGAWMISRRAFALPGGRLLLKIIVKTSLAYFLIWLTLSLLAETIFGMHWSEGQNLIWGGSSYAIYPALLAVPSCFMFVQDGAPKDKKLAWLTIFVIVISAFYFDTRSCYFVLLACMMIVAIRFDLKKLIMMALVFFSVLIFFTKFMWPDYQNFDSFWETSILSSSNLIWNQEVSELRPGDVGRFVHIHIAPQIFGNNPEILFIGTGYRASGWLIGPALAEFFMMMGNLGGAENSVNYESTVGITSLVLETGLIGMGLLVANMLCTWMWVKSRCKGQTKLFLGLILTASFFWLLVTNPTDMPLYFILIMPNGILYSIVKGNDLA